MRYQILDDGGAIINTIEATPEFVEQFYAGSYAAVEVEPTPEVTPRILTKLAYINRFTDEELVGIYSAAKVSVPVEVWLKKFELAEEINLDDERTIAGLHAMEASGLLAAGRANEILT